MKAAVLYEQRKPLVVETVDYCEPEGDEVLVKLAASGVCHSDLHTIDGQNPNVRLPVIMGHEGAGIVQAVGPAVTTMAPGDHVVLSWVPQCGRCHYCTIGRPNLCIGRAAAPTRMRFHKDGLDIHQWASVASFAEYTVVSEAGCVKIREDAPLDKASLVGCGVMTGVGAVINTARVRPGAHVLVIGCGGVGLNVIQGARLAGADKIIAADVLDNKLQFAREFGATHTINGANEDVVERVRDLTGGLGVEYAFEAIATVRTIRQAYDAVAPGGLCVVVGIAPPGSEVPIPTQSLLREKAITGSIYGSARMRVDIPRLVDLYMDKKLKLDELITQALPLEGVNQAFDDLRAGKVARSILTYA